MSVKNPFRTMIKISSLLLFGSVFCMAWMTQSYAQGKEPKGKATYYKYETENEEKFRDRVDYELPEPNVVIKEPEKGQLDPDSLSGYFFEGKNLHIQSDPGLQEWIIRDSTVKSKIKEVQGFKIQVYAGNNRKLAFNVK